MQKYVFISIIGLMFLSAFTFADNITLVDSHRGGVRLQWKLDNYNIITTGEYSIIDFPEGCGLYAVGKADLPSKQVFIEVPQDAEIGLSISHTVVDVSYLNKPIVPAQEPFVDTIGAEEKLPKKFVKDFNAYDSNEMFPGRVVEVAYQGIMRGRKLALIRFNPFQYIAKTGELQVYKQFEVDIEFKGATRSLGETDNAMEPISKALILNYRPATIRNEGDTKYLIITVADLESYANTFAQWKMQKGITTKVEVLGNNPSVTTVKDTIKKYYPGVIYVLILADHNLIALPTSGARHPLGKERCQMLGLPDETIPSDLYYSCLEGTDYYPDVIIGRVPAGTPAEAELLLNKLMNYERRPPLGKWLNRFLICGEFQYQYDGKYNIAERLFCETAYTIYTSLKDKYAFPVKTVGTGSQGLNHTEYFFRLAADPNDPTKPGTYRDKIRDENPPVINCKMPAEWASNIVSDAEAKANTIAFWTEGAILVQHRDHGSETGWGKPSLSKTDVANLTNGDRLPILFSVNCLTGAMDYSSGCFVEAALKNPNGGAAAAIGSTRVSYSWWNDRMCDGFYTCIYGTEVFDCQDVGIQLPTTYPFSKKLGVILNFGKMYLALNYPSNPWGTQYDYTETEFYLFHCIGDPEMDIWTGELSQLAIDIDQKEAIPCISVTNKNTRNPVSMVQISLYNGKDKPVVLHPDAQGKCQVPANLHGKFKLTATGENIYTYQSEVTLP